MVTYAAAIPRSHVGADEPVLAHRLRASRLPAILETHVRRIAFAHGEHARPIHTLAAEPVWGYAVCRYDLTLAGRFVQREPILFRVPTDHYLYAGGNPVSMADPTGRTLTVRGGTEEQHKALDYVFDDLDLPDIAPGGGASEITWSDPNAAAPNGGWRLDREIVWRMIRSKRKFEYANLQDLQAAIALRQAIVAAAESVSFAFGLPAGVPDSRQFSTGEAMLDEWFGANAANYHTGCADATMLVVCRAIQKSNVGRLRQAAPHGTFDELSTLASNALNSTETEDPTDWIPGDHSRIVNANPTPWIKLPSPPLGLEGENIIYMGGSFDTGDGFMTKSRFWGSFSDVNEPKPLQWWIDFVEGWSTDRNAKLPATRHGP